MEDFAKLQLNAVTVSLSQFVEPAGRTTVRLQYEGFVLGYAETGMSYVRDRIDKQFTILRDDARVFPMFAHPAMASIRDSASRSSYIYSARISVPSGLTVANGGRLQSVTEREGVARFHYTSLLPSSRTDFAIAQYLQLVEEPIRSFYFPEHEDAMQGFLGAGRRAMGRLSEWFGPLENRSSLTLIEIPDGWGSQADVVTILQSAGAFTDPARRFELYHELCHLWDPPSTDRPSPRLNEGLASFLQFLLVEEIDGRPAVDKAASDRLQFLSRRLPDRPRWTQVPLVDYGRAGITELSYVVGALFFDLLYWLVGGAAFIGALRRFDADYRAGGGNTSDLVHMFRTSASIDIGPLCKDWLQTADWTTRITQHRPIEELRRYYGGKHGTR